MKKQGLKSQIKGQREHYNHSPPHFPGRTTEDFVVTQMRRLLGFPRRHRGVTEIMAGALFFRSLFLIITLFLMTLFLMILFLLTSSVSPCLLLRIYAEVFHTKIIIFFGQVCQMVNC